MYTYRASRHLHSFPTRRSSDLGEADVLVVDVDVHEPVQRALLDQAGLEAAVVGLQVVDDLEANHGGLKSRLVKEGSLHRFVNVYVNDEDVRFAEIGRASCRERV